MFVRIRYFAKNECLCSFVFAIMQVKLEHVRVRSVFGTKETKGLLTVLW